MKNLIGLKFGRLIVASKLDPVAPGNGFRWLCKCECGNEFVIITGSLTSGNTKSCGCLRKDVITKHGHCSGGRSNGSSEYRSWKAMRERCLNPNCKDYKDYGSRGITVCARWLNSFENFLVDMGKKPTRSHTIERIDNNGNYEPGNCKWATRKEQGANKSNNRLIEFNGEKLIAPEWARRLGMKKETLISRLKRMSVERAFAYPVKSSNRRLSRRDD